MGRDRVSGTVVSSLPGGKEVWEYIATLNKIRCKPCGYLMECGSRAKVLAKQHAESAKHQKQIQLSLRTRQIDLDSTAENQPGNENFRDLTKCLIESNIPSSKVDNPHFEGFLEKYCRNAAPSSFTLRKCYLKNQ